MKNIIIIIMVGLTVSVGFAEVKIIKKQGKVMVRTGLEENWQDVRIGSILKDIDTILSTEKGQDTLEPEDGLCS
jgi:hypothetical protein